MRTIITAPDTAVVHVLAVEAGAFEVQVDDTFAVTSLTLTRAQVQAIVDRAAEHDIVPAGLAATPF